MSFMRKTVSSIVGDSPRLFALAIFIVSSIGGSSFHVVSTGNDVANSIRELRYLLLDMDNSIWSKEHQTHAMQVSRDKGVAIENLSMEDLRLINQHVTIIVQARREKARRVRSWQTR